MEDEKVEKQTENKGEVVLNLSEHPGLVAKRDVLDQKSKETAEFAKSSTLSLLKLLKETKQIIDVKEAEIKIAHHDFWESVYAVNPELRDQKLTIDDDDGVIRVMVKDDDDGECDCLACKLGKEGGIEDVIDLGKGGVAIKVGTKGINVPELLKMLL